MRLFVVQMLAYHTDPIISPRSIEAAGPRHGDLCVHVNFDSLLLTETAPVALTGGFEQQNTLPEDRFGMKRTEGKPRESRERQTPGRSRLIRAVRSWEPWSRRRVC
jgi:hypothetical protein